MMGERLAHVTTVPELGVAVTALWVAGALAGGAALPVAALLHPGSGAHERGEKHRTRHEPHHDVWTIDAAVMTPPMTV
jgi:hypothetical protein